MMLQTIRLPNTIILLAQGFNSPLTLYHCALLENRCPNNQGLLFDKVLFLSDGKKVTIGEDTVKGAKVKATVIGHGKSKKILVFNT